MGEFVDEIWATMDDFEDLDDIHEQERHHKSRLRAARKFFRIQPPRHMQRFADAYVANPKPRNPMAKPQRVSIKTPQFRGSYVNLAKPRARQNDDGTEGKEQYSIVIVLPKKAKSTKVFIEQLTELLVDCAKEKHGEAIFKRKLKTGKTLVLPPEKALKHWPIKDGDEADNEHLEGAWFINAASNFKPSVIDGNGDELSTADELYAGAYYKVKISPWAWANPKGGKGVSINLESALKVKDGDRIGGGSNAADDFADEVGEGGDSEDDDLLG